MAPPEEERRCPEDNSELPGLAGAEGIEEGHTSRISQ